MDSNSGFSETFDKYYDAYKFFETHKEEYDNLLIIDGDKVIEMEYGIVEFVGDDDICPYYSTLRNKTDYISGSYGVDGAYLYSSQDGQKVYFVVSGDRGYANINSVILHPYETLGVKTSLYEVKDNYLYHNIKTQLGYEFYSSSIQLDIKPEFMKDGNSYYSYDGHYFYDDFYQMIDDYKSEVYENAVNDSPYYNYYQYLSHRSLTNYTLSELENYFYDVLCMDGRLNNYVDKNNDDANDEVNRSQFYGVINEFFNNQYIYGCNALMLISSAIVESSYGKSLSSYLNNNLYTNAAYESSNELNNDRFDSIANSIYSHAKYFVSDKFSNHMRSDYNGTYFGNKAGGMNIEYSLDHYYGEKAASAYFKIDNALGLKDRNSESIGIVKPSEKLVVYKDSEFNEKLFTLNNINELSFVLRQASDYAYKIQIDYSFDDNNKYDFDNSCGYIDVKDLLYTSNLANMHDYNLNTINYDFNGGEYYGDKSLSIKTNDELFMGFVPYKEGYEFVGYTNDGASSNTANYLKIDNVKVVSFLDTQSDLLPYPCLEDAYLSVSYEDGSSKKININSDMISKYDYHDTDPQDVTITYNGISCLQTIQIDNAYYETYSNIAKAIDDGDYNYVKSNLDAVDYPYSMVDIRKLDYELKQINNRNYVINDKTDKYNISISGLDLSLDDRYNFHLIEDTYYVIVEKPNVFDYDKLRHIAKGYGLNEVEGLNISFKFNYQDIKLRGPAVVQVDLPNKTNDNIYTVYHLDGNGDVIKCRTTQTDNYIQFIIEEQGEYAIFSMPSVNKYQIQDGIEDLSYDNMGFDNNRINIEFMFGLVLILLSLALISFYYLLNDKKEKQWKDYKKSLLKADTVQEEKQNS